MGGVWFWRCAESCVSMLRLALRQVDVVVVLAVVVAAVKDSK